MQQRVGKGNGGELLTVPLHKLLDQVDELKSREKALQYVTSFLIGVARPKIDESRLQRQIDEEEGQTKEIQMGMTMWVDKYRPKRFTDLLGEDVRFCYAQSPVWS